MLLHKNGRSALRDGFFCDISWRCRKKYVTLQAISTTDKTYEELYKMSSAYC